MFTSIWPAPESLELGWVEPSGGGAATADPGRPWAAASGSRQVGLLGAVARGEWMGPSLVGGGNGPARGLPSLDVGSHH